MSVESFKQTRHVFIPSFSDMQRITLQMLDFKDYLMCCLSRTSIKTRRNFLVPDFFVLDPELELAVQTVLFDQSFV